LYTQHLLFPSLKHTFILVFFFVHQFISPFSLLNIHPFFHCTSLFTFFSSLSLSPMYVHTFNFSFLRCCILYCSCSFVLCHFRVFSCCQPLVFFLVVEWMEKDIPMPFAAFQFHSYLYMYNYFFFLFPFILVHV
jgi:hypothetical protein